MNPEQALTDIAKVIDNARPATPGLYRLLIVNKQITLHNKPLIPDCDGLLASLTSRDINDGPSARMWNQIHDRFAKFQKRGLI